MYPVLNTISMSSTNIVNNNSPNGNGVVFLAGGGSLKMLYCIFQNNQNYLLCLFGGSLEVSHSFIDHPTSFSATLSISTTMNNSFIRTQTYFIVYPGSQFCKIPIQSQYTSNDSSMIWIGYFIFFVICVTLIILLNSYRRIATNLLTRNQLEDSLQNDFG